MEKAKVLLRPDGEKGFRQVGRIKERRGKALTLHCEDGSTIEHTLGEGEMTPVEGSFIHLLRVSPDVVEKTLRESPERIFKQLLGDSTRPLSARNLKESFSGFSGVDNAWIRAKPVLEADDEVERHGKNQHSYALRDSVVVDLLDLLPPAERHHSNHIPDASADAEVTSTTVDGSSEEPRVEPRGAAHPSGPAEEPPPAGPAEGVAARDGGAIDDLFIRLSQRLPDLRLHSKAEIAERPLAVTAALQTLNKADRQAVSTDLAEQDARLLDALAPAVGESAGQERDGSLKPLLKSLLGAASRELRGSVTDKKARAGFLALAKRAAAQGASDPHALITGARLIASSAPSSADTDVCLHLLARLLDEEPETAISTWDLASLSRVASSVPFDRDGGRSSLVAALFRQAPEEARLPRWWERTEAGELAEAARGRLSRVLADETVARTYVAPLVTRLVAETGSRSGLSVLWGLPLPLARHVDARRLSRVVAEVASGDAVTAEWLRAMSNADVVEDLRRSVTSLDRDLLEARRLEGEARTHVARSNEQLRRVSEQLAAARNADVSLRGNRDRQVRLDLLRAFAVLAAQVKQSEAARADTALVRQVDHACRREGLTELAAAGQQVVYDPAQHDSLTPNLSAGSAASVLRSGYTWADGGESIVLVKVQVIAV